MLHARGEVSSAAADATLATCLTVGNRDLEPHIPAIVNCIAKADLVPDVIGKLSATAFVQVMACISLYPNLGVLTVAMVAGQVWDVCGVAASDCLRSLLRLWRLLFRDIGGQLAYDCWHPSPSLGRHLHT